MSFVEHLQAGTVPGPTSFRYSADAWNDAFQRFSSGDAKDARVHKAGPFIFDRLDRLRKEIIRTEQHMAERDAAEVVDRLASTASAIWVELTREESHTPPHEGFTALEHMATRRFSLDVTHAGYTSVEMIEGAVDSLRFPLRAIMPRKRFGAAEPKLPELSFREGVQKLQRLAHLYSMYERSWEQILWFDAQLLVQKNGSYVLSDGSSSLAREAAQDLARRNFSYQRDLHRLLSKPQGRRGTFERFPVVSSNGTLSSQFFFALDADVRDRISSVCLQRAILTSGEVQEVLASGSLPGTNISIRDALNVHLQLAVIATQLMHFALGPQGEVVEDALDIRFSETDLIDVISRCTRINPDRVGKVVTMLMFEPSATSDLWEQPLIQTRRGVALVAPPLVSVDVKRLIAAWSKEDEDLEPEQSSLQPAHSRRGHAFAAQVHEVLSSLASRTRLRAPVHVAGPNLKFPNGDIDCLLVYGDTAFVLECRITLHAASPFEHWSVNDFICRKVSQVLKECDYVRSHPEAVRRWTGVDMPITRVVGVVVTNSYMHEGTSIDGIRFIHADTLAHLVAYGGVLFGAVDQNGNEQLVRASAVGPHPADAFLDALSRGDKALFYRTNLSLVRNPMPSISGGGNPGEVHSWVVTLPPMHKMWGRLHQMPFAARLETVDSTEFVDL